MLKALIYWSMLTTITAGKDCGSLYTGNEFLVMAPIIRQHDHTPNLPELCQLFVYGDENTAVTVRTQSPRMNETKVIGSDGLATFDLKYDQVSINTTKDKKLVQEKGILLTSNRPIGVVVHVKGSDGYSAVPRNEHHVYVASSSTADNAKSYFAVSAFEDDTEVKMVVRISKNEKAKFNDKKYTDGEEITFTMDAFQILVVYGEGDLTGSAIESLHDKDVSVFSGMVCEPEKASGFLEQLLPITKFGNSHLVFPIDALATKLVMANDYKAIALHGNTTVNISGQSDVKHLDKVGNIVNLSSLIPIEYVADNPVMPVQILQINTHLSIHFVHATLVPYRCRYSSYRFIALSGYMTTLLLTMENADDLDDVTLDEKGLKDVAKSVYHNVQVMALVPEVSRGLHMVTSPGGRLMAVYVYGTANHSAVSFHAASWKEPVEKANTFFSHTAASTPNPPSVSVIVTPNQSAEKLDTSMACKPTTSLLAPSSTTTLTYTIEQLASSMPSSTTESTPAKGMLTSSMSSSTAKSTSASGVLTSSLIMPSTTTTKIVASAKTTATTTLASSTTTTTTTSTLESTTLSVPSHPNNSLCRCACPFQPPSSGPGTVRRLLLPVAKGSTGKRKRKLTSAPDYRATATGFGVIGIIVISIPLAGLLVADLGRIVKHTSSAINIQL